MRALIVLATAVCCHAAPKAAVPLVYTAGSAPVGVPSSFNTFMPFVRGVNPLVTSSTSAVFPQWPAPLSYASLPYPTLPLGFPARQYLARDKDGQVILSNVGGPRSFNLGTPFGMPMRSLAYFGGASADPAVTPTLKAVDALSSKSTQEASLSESMTEMRKTPATPAVKPALKTINTLPSKPVQEVPPIQTKAEGTNARADPAARPVFKTAGSPMTVKTVRVGAQATHPTVLFNASVNQPVVGAPVSPPAVAVVAMPSPLEAPNPPAPSPDVPFRGGRFHTQDELGQYSFGHFGGSHTRLENKDLLGHTRGSFAYLDNAGDVQVRKYAVAPGLGFTVAGSDIPVAPAEVSKVQSTHQDLKKEGVEAKSAGVESAGPAVTTV